MCVAPPPPEPEPEPPEPEPPEPEPAHFYGWNCSNVLGNTDCQVMEGDQPTGAAQFPSEEACRTVCSPHPTPVAPTPAPYRPNPKDIIKHPADHIPEIVVAVVVVLLVVAGGGFVVPTPANFYVNLPPLFLAHVFPFFPHFFAAFPPSCPQDSGNRHQDPEKRS